MLSSGSSSSRAPVELLLGRPGRDQRAEPSAQSTTADVHDAPSPFRPARMVTARCPHGELVCRVGVGECAARARVVGHHRLPVARCLRDADAARDRRREHRVAEVVAHLCGHLLGQPGARVVHRQQDRRDVQLLVEVRAHQLDVAQQLAEPFQRVELALDRDQHFAAGDQRVDREQAERGRAVDEDVVVGRVQRVHAPCAAEIRAPRPTRARSRRRRGRSSRARSPGPARRRRESRCRRCRRPARARRRRTECSRGGRCRTRSRRCPAGRGR